jgi:RNA polymerase sigma-70 factor, ECF subfamily
LPDEQREALILVGAGGFAYEEVARICGVAVGTIKSRVARARRALDKVLNGEQALTEAPRPTHAEAANDVLGQLDDLVSGKKTPAGATSEDDAET